MSQFMRIQSANTASKKIDEGAFKCKFCKRRCISPGQLQKHIKDIHTASSRKCMFCKKTFEDNATLQNHIHENHSRSPNSECLKCKNVIRNNENVESPIEKDNIVEAQTDLEEPIRASVIVANSNIPSRDKPKRYDCHKCKHTSTTYQDIKDHKRTHDMRKTYLFECRKCNISFKYENDLRSHIDQNHVVDTRIPCQQCNRRFNNKTQLIRHINREHYEVEFPLLNRRLPENEYYPNPHIYNQHKEYNQRDNRNYDHVYNNNNHNYNYNENTGGYRDRGQQSSSRSGDWPQNGRGVHDRFGQGHEWNGFGSTGNNFPRYE